MNAKLIDGKKIASNLLNKLQKDITNLKKNDHRIPGLAVILIGNDPASKIYVNKKQQTALQLGVNSLLFNYNLNLTEKELLNKIKILNQDPTIDGILVQLPLPRHINSTVIMNAISPLKDVDGFHPYNIGALTLRKPQLRPCTPAGIVDLIKHTNTLTKGLEITILGASNIVGRPMLLEALLMGATPTICHKFSKNIEQHIRQADCLISAVGKPNFVKGDWIKPGAIVIDVGINRLNNGKIIGDVEFSKACQHAAWITPVPGGVGPMTVAKLMENTLKAYQFNQ